MTDRQKIFAENFIKLGDEKESAVKAGYSEKNAQHYAEKLLQNEEVKQYINSFSKAKDNEILTTTQCKAVLSKIVSDEDNTPTERMKAIDLLIGIDDEHTDSDNNISISINYGDKNEN